MTNNKLVWNDVKEITKILFPNQATLKSWNEMNELSESIEMDEEYYDLLKYIGKYRYDNELVEDKNYYFSEYLKTLDMRFGVVGAVMGEIGHDLTWVNEVKMTQAEFFKKCADMIQLFATILFSPSQIFDTPCVRIIPHEKEHNITIYLGKICLIHRRFTMETIISTFHEILVFRLRQEYTIFSEMEHDYKIASEGIERFLKYIQCQGMLEYRHYNIEVLRNKYLYICIGTFHYRGKICSIACGDLSHPLRAELKVKNQWQLTFNEFNKTGRIAMDHQYSASIFLDKTIYPNFFTAYHTDTNKEERVLIRRMERQVACKIDKEKSFYFCVFYFIFDGIINYTISFSNLEMSCAVVNGYRDIHSVADGFKKSF